MDTAIPPRILDFDVQDLRPCLQLSWRGVAVLVRIAEHGTGGPQALGARGPDPGWEAENRRYDRNAHIGLVLVVVGTLMEAVPPFAPP